MLYRSERCGWCRREVEVHVPADTKTYRVVLGLDVPDITRLCMGCWRLHIAYWHTFRTLQQVLRRLEERGCIVVGSEKVRL